MTRGNHPDQNQATGLAGRASLVIPLYNLEYAVLRRDAPARLSAELIMAICGVALNCGLRILCSAEATVILLPAFRRQGHAWIGGGGGWRLGRRTRE